MWDSMKTPEELETEQFFERVSDEIHRLFFPPAPASNMALFRKRITEAIKRQRVREAEAEKETAAERFRLVRDDPRRQDIGAGPPDDRPIRTKETVTDPDTGDSLEGWLGEWEGVVWPQSITEADTPEESLPCLYLEIGRVHDWTEEDWELKHGRPPRPKLLAGFDLADEITDKNVSWADHFVGKYCPGVFPSEDRDRRRQIERALADVKGDLAAPATGEAVSPFPWGRVILLAVLLLVLESGAFASACYWGEGKNWLQKIDACRRLFAYAFGIVVLVAPFILGRATWVRIKRWWKWARGEAQ